MNVSWSLFLLTKCQCRSHNAFLLIRISPAKTRVPDILGEASKSGTITQVLALSQRICTTLLLYKVERVKLIVGPKTEFARMAFGENKADTVIYHICTGNK